MKREEGEEGKATRRNEEACKDTNHGRSTQHANKHRSEIIIYFTNFKCLFGHHPKYDHPAVAYQNQFHLLILQNGPLMIDLHND